MTDGKCDTGIVIHNDLQEKKDWYFRVKTDQTELSALPGSFLMLKQIFSNSTFSLILAKKLFPTDYRNNILTIERVKKEQHFLV